MGHVSGGGTGVGTVLATVTPIAVLAASVTPALFDICTAYGRTVVVAVLRAPVLAVIAGVVLVAGLLASAYAVDHAVVTPATIVASPAVSPYVVGLNVSFAEKFVNQVSNPASDAGMYDGVAIFCVCVVVFFVLRDEKNAILRINHSIL